MIPLAVCAFFAVADIPPDYCFELSELPLLASWYNPSMGGMNCDLDDWCHVLADGLPWTPADYDHVAACIPEWHYATVVTVAGVWHCRDTGSAVVVRNHPVFGPVIHIDILRPGPFPWGDINLIHNWRLQ